VQLDIAQGILDALMVNPLVLMVVLPLLASVLAYLLGSKGGRLVTLLVVTMELALSLLLALGTPPLAAMNQGMSYYVEYQLASFGSGLGSLRVILGVDGISTIMVLLSNLVVFIAAISSNHIKKSEGTYYALFLLLQSGLLGVFMSLDLLGFFIFWELVLIPMFFIIGGYGEEGCQHAAVKFFIYTHFGSGVMLVGFFSLWALSAPVYTFSMLELRGMGLDPMVQIGFAIAVFFGAGVKLPVWPLHNWLPWAHVKAPTPGSVILAGILLKMGGYAFVRLGLWMVPDAIAQLAIPFAALAVFTCIYAAFTAMAQTDMKSLVAYTSINHMAWVLLGVAAFAWNYRVGAVVAANLALQGAIFMMFSHGTIISVMFIVAGQLKYAAGTRDITVVSGLMNRAPKLAAVTILASFAAFGLPGFSGFIAEVLVLFGSVVTLLWAALITFGIFITVGYILWMLNRVVFSDPDPEKEINEAPWSDLIAPILMLVPVILLGIWPDLVLNILQPVIASMLGGLP
jgi:proton-translocating NADH-quinone oxidoreductase chain M